MKNFKCFWFILILFLPLLSNGQAVVSSAEEEKIKVVFALKGGFYHGDQEVALECPEANIYYTLDGSTPDSNSTLYTKPVWIEKTTVLRAVAYKEGLVSNLKGHTYFIDEPATKLPVVSIGVTPSVLFDASSGLYMQGPDAIDSLWTKDGANFWSKREVTVNTEFFEADGKQEFRSVTGFRLFGGMSRLFPQKSMALIARDDYGKKRFRHRIFGKEGFKKYKFLVLRNSGSDFGKSHFRDALMTGLVEDWDLEKQSYRPAHVYINGEYWGIYNIREKINRYFVEAHTGVDKDSLDLIEHRSTIKRGSRKHYLSLLRFMESNDLSEAANYAFVGTQMDIENFMDYQIAQIYFDNRDAGGNIKFWRPQTPNGRWRWILYDTDWGFGLHDPKAYRHNSLAFHTEPDGPAWPNPKWSTFILRKLMENKEFQEQFVVRFSDYLNTSFKPETVLAKIDELAAGVKPELPRHFERWQLNEKHWDLHVARMQKFAEKRVKYMRYFLAERFETGDLASLTVYGTTGGHTVLNGHVNIKEEDYTGLYFDNYDLTLTAMPDFGHRFIRWEGVPSEDARKHEITLSLKDKKLHKVKAVFEKYEHPLVGQIMINEISPNNKKTGDWVEIYNDSKHTVNLENWYFTDTKQYYTLPYTQIKPKSYLIVCEDTMAFRKVFPNVYNIVGNFDFGLSKHKEKLGLFDNDGAAVDSVAYEVIPADSTTTIGLLLPFLDNGDADNWEVNGGKGTPNRPNPYYLESRIKTQQALWVRIGVGVGLLLCTILVLWMRSRKSTIA